MIPVRRGGRVSAWIGYEIRLSGFPDPTWFEQIELDCVGRRHRQLHISVRSEVRPPREALRPDRRSSPIGPGGTIGALATRLRAN